MLTRILEVVRVTGHGWLDVGSDQEHDVAAGIFKWNLTIVRRDDFTNFADDWRTFERILMKI